MGSRVSRIGIVVAGLLLAVLGWVVVEVGQLRRAARDFPDALSPLPLEQLPDGLLVPPDELSFHAWVADGSAWPFIVNTTDTEVPIWMGHRVYPIDVEALGDDGWFRVNPYVQAELMCGHEGEMELHPDRFVRGWRWDAGEGPGEPATLRFRWGSMVSREWVGTYDPEQLALVSIDSSANEAEVGPALWRLVEEPHPGLADEGALRDRALQLLLDRDTRLARARVLEDLDHPLREELLARLRWPTRSDLHFVGEALAGENDPAVRDLVRLHRFSDDPGAAELMRRAMADEPLGATWVERLLQLEIESPMAWIPSTGVWADEPFSVEVDNPGPEPVELRYRDPVELFDLGTDAWPRPPRDISALPEQRITLMPGESHSVVLVMERYIVVGEEHQQVQLHLAVRGLSRRTWNYEVRPTR